MPSSRVKRSPLVWVAVGAGSVVAVAGIVVAAAASMNVSSDSLAADTLDASACDSNGITVGITTPMNFAAGSSPGFTVIQFALSGVDAACDGVRYRATLQNSSGNCTAQGDGTLSVSGGNSTVDLRSSNCTLGFNTGLTLTLYD